MITQEDIDIIKHCKHKGYVTQEDTFTIWMNYDQIFGEFKGSRTCTDCIQNALKQLILYINENQL